MVAFIEGAIRIKKKQEREDLQVNKGIVYLKMNQ